MKSLIQDTVSISKFKMKELLLTEPERYAFSIMLISLALIILSRTTIEIMMRTNSLTESLFSTCYALICFHFPIPLSAITLIIMAIVKEKNAGKQSTNEI